LGLFAGREVGVVGDVAGLRRCVSASRASLWWPCADNAVVAQVDSSIGGKTGVKSPRREKISSAHSIRRASCLTDPELLRTLPDARIFGGGLAEVVKHSLIADAAMFAMLEKNLECPCVADRAALDELNPAQHPRSKRGFVGRG